MLAKLLRRLLPSATANTQAGPAHWLITAYEHAPTDGRFGPAERSELAQLIAAIPHEIEDRPFKFEYTTLHGYLCCIVIGPRDLPTARWLQHLLGNFPKEPTPDYLRLLALMRRLAAEIETDFKRPKPHLRLPASDVGQGPATKTPGPQLLPLQCWCASFLLATQLEAARWERIHDPEYDYEWLEMLWIYGTSEGRQHQINNAYRIYREEGYGPEEIMQMVQRFLRLPSTHRNMLSGLRKDLRKIWWYWGEGKEGVVAGPGEFF
jgi:yecA family protein